MPGVMNQLEQRYATHLSNGMLRGTVAAWWFEPMKLRLADRTYYSPDFLVMKPDGGLELHECKGFMMDDAAVKLKVTASTYWIFPVYLVKETKGTRGVFTLTQISDA